MADPGAGAGGATVPAGLVLGPRAAERPRDAGWVLASTLAGRHPARIDGAGLVSPEGAAWSVDWWVGADDRWYLPAREPTVRQRRLGAGPVIETAVRIPSGDARAVAYAALVGGAEVTVVEVHNDSPVPVALAIALRPYPVGDGPTGGPAADPGPPGSGVLGRLRGARRSGPAPAQATAAGRLTLDGTVVARDGRPVLVLPRAPGHAGAAGDRDLLAVVEAGEPVVWADDAAGDRANAVLLFPLPHRTSLRFLVLPDPPGPDPSGPSSLRRLDPVAAPDAERVVRGWDTVVASGARLSLPDPGLGDLAAGAWARLLVGAPGLGDRLAALAPGAGVELAALAAGGHHREVSGALEPLAASFPAGRSIRSIDPANAAELLAALAPALDLVDEAADPGTRPDGGPDGGSDLRRRLVELALQLVRPVERTGSPPAGAAAQRHLAALVAPLDPDGAAGIRSRLDAAAQLDGVGSTLAEVNALAAGASPAGAWGGAQGDDAVAAGRFLLALRGLLVDDTGPGLVLLPGFPASWRGGPLEVHDLPTAHGRVSFALRWHGYRPALLWQLDGAPVELTAPTLDAGWRSDQARGEALLTGSPDDLPPAPAPGDNFS